MTEREPDTAVDPARLIAENEALRDLAEFVIRLHRQQKDPLRAIKPDIALRAAAQRAERVLGPSREAGELDPDGPER